MNEDARAIPGGRVGDEKIVARLMEGEEERGRGECGRCWKVRESDDGLWELWAALTQSVSQSLLTQLTLLAWVPAGRGVAPGSRSGSSSFPASQQTIN